jgi:hypothetical protein
MILLTFGDMNYWSDQIIEFRANVFKSHSFAWSLKFPVFVELQVILNEYDGNFYN